MAFGIIFEGPAPLENFMRATITLGEHRESVWIDCSCWTPNEYQFNWQVAARRMLAGAREQLFCIEFTPDWIGILVGRATDAEIWFCEVRCPASQLSVKQGTIELAEGQMPFDLAGNTSRWRVPSAELLAFVSP